ncbi:MAG: ROK family protein [Thermodesulfovibrionales bacterium]|nr:ROK family protein [Thermodesulfovibrionales bacterium]
MPAKKIHREVGVSEMANKYVIAADMGGTNTRVALVRENGSIEEKLKETTGAEPLDNLVEMIKKLHRPGIHSIGIAVAGVLNNQRTGVFKSPNISSIEGVDLVNFIKKETGISKVVIENDANAAALGEAWLGAGKKFNFFALFTLGTGIGGGIVCDGTLAPLAAEFGHMTIVANGESCLCGNVGCLELYASGRAIVDRAIHGIMSGTETRLSTCCEGSAYRINPEIVYEMALEGDAFSREVLRAAGRYLGIGIANIINILSPQAIILTGGLTGMWNIYVQEAIKEAQKRAFRELFDNTQIIPSELGEDAGLLGAARLALIL